MTVSQRLATAFAASVLAVGLAASPVAFAADAMHDSMHKTAKKKDAMHGSAMKKQDAMKKEADPAQ